MDISKEELYKAIGTKIRAMRTAKGWTQEELGNKFDVYGSFPLQPLCRLIQSGCYVPVFQRRYWYC